MQRMLVLATAVALLAGAAPAAQSVEAETAYTRLLDDIVAAIGYVPATALLNGVEVPTHDALALLRENAAPGAATQEASVPPDDIGFGIRQGANGCLIAGVLTVVRFDASQGLINEEFVGVPGGRIPCGRGYDYGTGIASAEISNGSTGAACVNTIVAGSWLNSPNSCQPTTGGGKVTMVGHVGFIDILVSTPFFTQRIEQMFCGVAGWAPGPAGTLDACVIKLQR